MRQPGIEPGSTAWKAAMLTTIPLTLVMNQGWFTNFSQRIIFKSYLRIILEKVTAVTRIRTWVTAATTQGPNH